MEIFHTIDIMLSLRVRAGQGARTLFCEFCEFGEVCEICEFCNICEFRDCCSGTSCAVGHQAGRKIVLCIACSAYSVTIAVIIPSFVVFLDCLYPNPRVLLFVHSPPHPVGRGRGVSKRLSGPSCRVKP